MGTGNPESPKDTGRGDLKGSATGTPGLTALDEEREASLADEGGASAAVVESQDPETLRRLADDLPVGHLVPCKDDNKVTLSFPPSVLFGLAGVVGLLGVLLLQRARS